MQVLDYTIVAMGLPYQAQGIDHVHALLDFIDKPPIQFGYRKGNYAVTDGEVIHVVGLTQEAHSAYGLAQRRVEHLRAKVADPRYRKKPGQPSKEELRRQLEDAESELIDAEPRPVSISFVMQARVVFDAVPIEELTRREERIAAVREPLESKLGFWPDMVITLQLNYERQHPIDKLRTGTPQSIDDEGVWMHGKLIPWDDIDGF